MLAYIVDDEIQPVDKVLRATLEVDERSRVVWNILASQISERATREGKRILTHLGVLYVKKKRTDVIAIINVLKSYVLVAVSPHKTHLSHLDSRSMSSESDRWDCSDAGPCMRTCRS